MMKPHLRLVLFITICLLVCVTAHKRTRTRPRLRTSGNLLLPTPISLDEFKREVVGKVYKELYILEEPFDFNPLKLRNLACNFTSVDLLVVDARDLETNMCLRLPLPLTPNEAFPGKAVFDTLVGPDPAFFAFFSENPSEYLYEFVCFGPEFNEKECTGSAFVSLLTPNDPPNRFPWIRAVKDLRRQMCLDLTDPRNLYTRILDVCPEPSM